MSLRAILFLLNIIITAFIIFLLQGRRKDEKIFEVESHQVVIRLEN
jgi:hypothetical protein